MPVINVFIVARGYVAPVKHSRIGIRFIVGRKLQCLKISRFHFVIRIITSYDPFFFCILFLCVTQSAYVNG